MSSPGKQKNQFELEVLEPRVLLSADTALASAFAGAALQAQAHQPVEHIHHESVGSQGAMSDAIISQPEPGGSGGIFDGMATEAIPSSPQSTGQISDASQPTSATEQGKNADQTGVADSSNSSTEVQAESSSQTTVAQTASTARTPISQDGSTATATSSGNVAAQQSTMTLTAANAPPGSGRSGVSSSEGTASVNQYIIQINASQVELLDQAGNIVSSQSLANSAVFTVSGSSNQDNLFVIQGSVLDQAGLRIRIVGGNGTDTLQVKNDAGSTRQWNITGDNSGLVANVSFSSIEHLKGAANNCDTFTVESGAVFNGVVDGGVGGFDTLELQGVTGGSYTPGAVFGDGTVVAGQSQIQFTGLEPVVIDGAGVSGTGPTGLDTSNLPSSFTFTPQGSDNVITISSSANGENTISGTSDGVAFESVTFKNVANVTIDTSVNDGAAPSQGDTVGLVGDLSALGLKQLTIKTGNGNDLIDLSKLGAIGTVAISIDGGAGNNTLVASSGQKIVLTDTSLSVAPGSSGQSQQIATLSNIQVAELTAPQLDTSGFTGTVTGLPDFPVLGQSLGLDLTSGFLLEKFFQGAGLQLSDLSSMSASAIASALQGVDAGGTVNTLSSTAVDMKFQINLAQSLNFSADLELNALNGSIQLSGSVKASAEVALNLVFGVDGTGFYIDSSSQPANTPEVVVNHLAVDGSSLSGSGNFGLVNVTISHPTANFDSSVGLTLSLASQSVIRLADVPGLSSVTLQGTSASLSLDVDLSTVFGSTNPQNFVFTWANVTQSDLPAVSGTGVDYLRLKLSELSQVLANGLIRLQAQSGVLSDLIGNESALTAQLPLVNKSLLSVLNLGADLSSALGVGSAVSAYLSQLDTSTDLLTVPNSGAFVLTDGITYVALAHDATAAQIQSALENFGSIGTGNVTVTAGASAGTFDIKLQPLGAGPNATSLSYASLSAVAVNLPQLNNDTTSVTLTITTTSGTYTITESGVGGLLQITSDSGSPVSASQLGLNFNPATLVENALTPGSFTISGKGITTDKITLTVSAGAIEEALNAATAFGANAFVVTSGSNGGVNIVYVGSGTAPTLTLNETFATLTNGQFTPGYITFTGTPSGASSPVTTGKIILSPSSLQSALNSAFASYYSNDSAADPTTYPDPFNFTSNADGSISITYNGGVTSAPTLSIGNKVGSTFQSRAFFNLELGNFSFFGTPAGSSTATTTGNISLAIADSSASSSPSASPAQVIQDALDAAFGSGVFTVTSNGAAFGITYAGSGSSPVLNVQESPATLVNGAFTPGFITLSANISGVVKTTAPIYVVASSGSDVQNALNNAFKTTQVAAPFSVVQGKTVTSSLNYNAADTDIQSALAGLAGIGTGNIQVTAVDKTAGHLTFTIEVTGSLIALPHLTVSGTGNTLATANTSALVKQLYIVPGQAGNVFVLTDGSSYTSLSVYASASDIQSALEGLAGFGQGSVSVTSVPGLPGDFLVTSTQAGTALPSFSVVGGASATIQTDILPFEFPTVQGIVDHLNSALSSALAGTPLSIQAGFDASGKILSFDVNLDFSATFSTNLSLGDGFNALGLDLSSGVPVVFNVGALLDFSVGVDLSSITSTDTTPAASDFYVQFNRVEMTGSVSLPDINIGISGNIGPASGTLQLVNGAISLTGTVDLGFGAALVLNTPTYDASNGTYQLNGLTPGDYYFWKKAPNDASLQVDGTTTLTESGIFQATQSSVILSGTKGATVTASVNAQAAQIPFDQMGSIGSIVTFMPSAVLSLNLPIQGQLTSPGLTFDGTFTVTVPSYDFFSNSTPQFNMTLAGTLTVADYFQVSGTFGFASTSGNLVRNDGQQFTNASYLTVSGTDINIFAGNAAGQSLAEIFAGNSGSATGLVLQQLDFSLLLFKDQTALPQVNYTALETSGGSASLIGIDGLTLNLNNFNVKFNETSNTANPNLVLDFNRGGKVVGNPVTPLIGSPINIEGESGSLLVVSGGVVFNAFGSVLATANFTMTRQIINVQLAGGGSSLANDTLLNNATLLNFTMTNVNLFAGVNGKIVYDQNNVASLDPSGATGFALTDGSLGLALITANPNEISGDGRMYLAMTAHLGSAAMLGLPDGMVVNASDITIQINRAFGSVPGSGSTPVSASALDWTSALDLNNDTTFGDTLTFFTGTPQATDVAFAGEITEVSGTLALQISTGSAVVLEANATFALTVQMVNVKFDPASNSGGVDLSQAQLLSLDLKLFDPDALYDGSGNIISNGPQRGLIIGEPGGFGFAIDSGDLTYVQVTPNADPNLSPAGFAGAYYAISVSVNGAKLNGLPTGFTVEATQLNFAMNRSKGNVGATAPTALDWTTMVDTNANDATFTSSPVMVGGNPILFTTAEFSISGTLTLNLKGFVLGSGSFAFSQTGGQTVSDGTSLTSTPLTDVTIQEVVVSHLNLFIGVNGAFGPVDANGNATIDPNQGTGFSVSDANLELVTVTETTGQQRSWLGMIAQIGHMTVQGLPAGSFMMEIQSLNLLYNGADKTTGTKLNWAGLIVGSGSGSPSLSAYLNSLNQSNANLPQLNAGFFDSLTDTTDFSASGTVYLNISGFVIVSGTFSITEQSGVAVNDGTVNLTNASVLVIRLTDVNLFVGTGGITAPTTGILYQPNAVGFSVSGASLDLAFVSEDPTVGTLSWVGVAANIQAMSVIGLPTGFTLNVLNLNLLDNIAATDGSRLDWQALADQSGDVYGLDGTAVAALTNAASFSVTGTMTVSIANYVYVSGSFALQEKVLSATTDGFSTNNKTYTDMSALIFGASNVKAFVGAGGPYWTTDQNGNVVADPNSHALGVAVTVDNLSLVLMKPVVATGSTASTKSYFALQASGSAELIGVSNVTLNGQLNIAVNEGRDTALATPSSAPAVNFATSAAADPTGYGDATGLKVVTGPGVNDYSILDYSSETLSASGFLSLGISQFVYATGNFAIQQNDAALVTPGTVTLAGGGTVTDVSVLTIGASNVNIFIGTGGPYFQDSNGDGVINASDTPASAGATGVAFSNISFGLALMSSQTSASSFYALQASGSGALVGVSGITMAAENMTIQVNGGSVSSTGPPTDAAVDLLASFGNSGLSVPTGPSSSIALKYSTSLLSVSGSVTLTIGNNVYISGDMSFSKGGTVTATLSDGSTKEVSVLTVGASSVNIFMGVNGPASNSGAVGISLTNGAFGLALLTPTDARDASRYYAVEATASSISLQGISALQVTGTDLKLLVNGSSGTTVPDQVVDFARTDWTGSGTPEGYLSVGTGPSTSVELSATQGVIEASGTLNVSLLSGLVQLSGSVAVKISNETVILSDSSSLLVNSFEFGMANGTATVSPTPGKANSDSATLSGVTLGLAYYTPTNPVAGDKRSWLGLQTIGGTVTGGSGSVQAGISNFAVSLNQGYGTLAKQANTTAVNFSASFNGALKVETGGVNAVSGAPITVSLGFEQPLLSLSAEVTLNIGNFFYAHGTFNFTTGPTKLVNLVNADGSAAGSVTVSVETLGVTNATVFAGNVGDGNAYASEDGTLNPTDVGFALTGVNFVVVKMSATDGSGREWTAVEATANSAGLVGLSGFSLSVNSVQVQVNTGNAKTNNTFVNFDSSYAPNGSTTGGELVISTGGSGPDLNIGYTGKVTQVAANATLILGNYVYISGTFDFQTGGTATATLSDGSTKQVSIMTVGASDVNIFVGTGGPYFQDSNHDGVIDGSDTPAAAGAMGLAITNARFGLALIKPISTAGTTGTADTSSYYGLSATASKVNFVGLGNDGSGNPVLSLAVSGLSVHVNGGTDAQKPNRVIDFTKTRWDGDANPAPGSLSVATGGTPVILDFASAMTSVSADNAVLSIAGFVQVEGGFSYSKSTSVLATLSDGMTKSVDVTTISFTNVSAFVGAGPYFMVDAQGNIETTTGAGNTVVPVTNPDAAGVLLTNANLSIALFKPTVATDSSSYYAVSASAAGISLPGLNTAGSSDSFNFSAGGYQIQVNGGTAGVAVNFATTYPAVAPSTTPGLTVGNVNFDFTSPLQEVAIVNAVLNISDYVYLSGSFSFTHQTDMSVTLSDISSTRLAVTSYAFGASNVDVFVGDSPNGPAFAADGSVDPSAVGLVLQNVNFGLIVMKPTTANYQANTYIALKASAGFAGFVGINGFTLSASGINVELNTVSNPSNATDTTVVDFSKMSGGSYQFNLGTGPLNPVGNGPLTMNYDSKLLRASVDNADLQIGSYVYVQGSFFFEKGADQNFQLSGSNPGLEKMSAIKIGASNVSMFFGVDGPYVDATTTPNAVGLTIQGGTLGLVLLTPAANVNDPNRYIALDASATTVTFVGAGSDIFNLSASNVNVQLNLATGSGVTGDTPVVDFSKLSGGSYAVSTGTTTPPVNLDFSARKIHASADNVLVTVGSFLYVNGSVAFDLGTRQTVIVNTGIPASLVDSVGQSTVSDAINSINSLLGDMQSGLNTLEGSIQNQLQQVITTIQSTVSSLEDSVVNTIANTIQTQLNSALSAAQAAVTSSVTQALNNATSGQSVDTAVDALVSPIVNAAPAGPLRNLISTMLNPIKSLIASKFGDVIQKAISGAVNRIAGSVSSAINAGVQSAAAQLKVKIKAALDPQFARIYAELQNLILQVGGEIAPVFQQLQAFANLHIGSNFGTLTGVVADVTTIGISNGNAFVGLGFDPTKPLSAQTNLTGLEIQNLNLGLAMFKPVSKELPSFTAAKVTATNVSLQLGSTANSNPDVIMSAHDVEVDLNLGGPIIPGTAALLGNATIDFLASFPVSATNTTAGFKVQTDTSGNNFINLNYDSELIQASVSNATLKIFSFVYVTGSFAFSKGTVQTVNVTGGLAATASAFLSNLNLPAGLSIPATGATNTTLSFLTVGAADVHAFVGVGGPYWTVADTLTVNGNSDFQLTDGSNTVTVTYSSDNTTLAGNIQTALAGLTGQTVTVSHDAANGNFIIQTSGSPAFLSSLAVASGSATSASLATNQIVADPSSNAIGLVVNDFNFGLAIMRPTNPLDFERYFALQASATNITLVGVPGVTVTANRILVAVNESSPSVYGVPIFPVVDFANTPQFASEELKLFDTNHNGQITLGELASLPGASNFTELNGVSQTDATVVDEATLAAILNSDTNANSPSGRGQVTVNEAGDLLGGTPTALAQAKAADVNGDGVINPGGFKVNTGGTPVYLNMDSPLILAQGFLDLNVEGVVALRGSFAFDLGPTANVTTVDSQGNTGTDQVMTLTVGASNVSAFVGWGGGFDPNNPTSDTLTSGAKGLLLQNLNVGIFFGLSTNLLNPQAYFAMNFSVDSIGIVGLDFLQASATLSASVNVGGSLSAGLSVIDFKDSFPASTPGGSAGFEVNTGDPLNPVLLDFTGFLINVQIAGDLNITSNSSPIVQMQGVFFLNIDNSGLEMFASADLRVGSDIGGTGTPLLGISALGVLVINHNGLAADLDVNLHLNVPGISLSAGARIIINTTGSQQGVALPDRIMNYLKASTNPLASNLLGRLTTAPGSTVQNYYKISQYAPNITNPDTVAGLLYGNKTVTYTSQTNYVVGIVSGSVTFAGFATATGTLGIAISQSGFQLYANLAFGIGVSGISLNFSAVGIVSISSAGLYLNLDVTLNADLTKLFHVNANGKVLIDTTGATNRFMLSLHGTLTIASVLNISGSFSINVGAGGPNTWRIAMSLSGSLGPITLTASGWIQSDGQFNLSIGGSIYLGVKDFSISGGVNGTVSLIKSGTNYVYHSGDTYTLTVRVSGHVTLDILGVDFGASVTLGGSATIGGSSSTLTLYASGTVTILGISYTKGGTVATISIPNTIFVGSPPPDLASISGGVLSLNVGSHAGLRNVGVGSADESYVLTDLGGGVVRVQAFGSTETYSGVTSVSANFGGGNDSLTLNPGFALPVTASGTSGNKTVISQGSGTLTWTGGSGTNTVVGGSGNDTIYAGSGTNYLTGGLGNDRIYNQQNGLAYIFGETGSFTFAGSTLTSMSSTPSASVPGNNTIYASSGTTYIIGGGGSDTIHGGGTNYIIGDTGTFNFTSGVLTAVIAGAARDSGNDTIDTGTGGTNVITLTEDPTTQANTFTLAGDSWSGTLQGAGGSNTIVEMTPTLVSGTVNYVLSDAALAVTGAAYQNLTLNNIQVFNLTGASTTGSNFDISAWTGSGSLTGQAGAANSLVATNDAAVFTLTNATLNRTGHGDMALANIQTATLTGGASPNTFNVHNWSGSVSMDGKDGNDHYNLTLTGVGLGLFVVADTGVTQGEINILNITNSADTQITSTQVFVGTQQQVTYSGIELLNVNATVGGLNYYVRSTLAATTTTITTQGSANSIYVGSTAGVTTPSSGLLDTIEGPLAVVGGGSDTLTLDDTADTNSRTLTQTTTILTGLGMGSGGIQYQGISVLNISLGDGGNTIFIQGNPAITTENLDPGAGANIISLGSQAAAVIANPIMDITNPLDGQVANTGSVMDNVLGVINIANNGTNILNVDDSGSTTGIGGGLWSDKLQILNPGQTAIQLTVNFSSTVNADGKIISGITAINLSLSQGADSFVVVDTIASSDNTQTVMIYGNGGDDTFLIFNTHTLMSIFGGAGADNFYNFGNSSVLNLFGNAGDDSFYIYASLVENTTNVTTGTADQSNKVYSYRVNAPVNIDGGAGNNTIYIFGTVLNDTITITATGVSGAGLDVTYKNIQRLFVAGLQGNDTFYIESISIPTTLIGDGTIVLPSVDQFLQALNVSLPDTTGGATPSSSFSDTFYVGWRGPSTPGSLAGIQAPLTIYGDNGPNTDGTTTAIPNTDNIVYVDDSADTADQSFALTPGLLTSTAMGTDGQIRYDSAVEHFNAQFGSGNDSLVIADMIATTVTTIDGGAGENDAVMSFSGDFAATDLTLLNFQTNRLSVVGDFTGLLNDQGGFSTVTIGGAMTSTGVFNAGSIDQMTVGNDLAGLLNVTGLLNTLAIGGGSPGKIVAGSINYITVQAGYGNKVFQVIEGGIERQIQANPVGGGPLSSSLQFTFIYDSSAAGNPQLAMQISNNGEVTPHSFNLALVVFDSNVQFDLALAYASAATGLSNLAVDGDILFAANAAEFNFLQLDPASRSGVVLPFDNITGLEVSGILPIGKVEVAGIEGVAFGILETMHGQPVNILRDLRAAGLRPKVLWNLLGSQATLLAATDSFLVPFNEHQSVQLFAQCNQNQTLEYAMTFTDELNDGAPVVAQVTLLPGRRPAVQNISFYGDGGAVMSRYGVETITGTGSLGDITLNGKGDLGNITAASIFGNINVEHGAVTGTIQTTGIRIDPVSGAQTTVSGDIGQATYDRHGTISGVTSIYARKGFADTAQLICRGDLISSVNVHNFNGLLAVQGNVGMLLTNADGSAKVDSAGGLTRFGGLDLRGKIEGQIIVLGNVLGDVNLRGRFTGRMAVEGTTITGLDSSRTGILGNMQIHSSIRPGAAVISGGMIGDAAGGTAFKSGKVRGFLAADGEVNLAKPRTVSGDALFADAQTNANGEVIDAIFTDQGSPLQFDSGGTLVGLGLIRTDLTAIGIVDNQLGGTTP